MMLDLCEFFLNLKNVTYCIIKPSKQLPSYTRGSDIDIFCYDTSELVKIILKTGNQYIDKNLEIIVINMTDQVYIDFIDKQLGDIEFRFDIYGKLPSYRNLLIKPAFFENVLENRVLINLGNDCSVFVPSLIDDNILRYIEYQEWYEQRPDKIKHINYILESCTPKEKNSFLEKLHYYTELPPVESTYPIKQKPAHSIKVLLRKILSKLPDKVKSSIKRFM